MNITKEKIFVHPMPFMRFLKLIKNIFSINHQNKNQYSSDTIKTSFPKEESYEKHELIERNDIELEYFNKWKNSPCRNKMLTWIAQEYLNYKNNGICDPSLMFLIIPSVNGFVIQFNAERWHEQDFICLLDYFKDKLTKEEGYFSQVSDIKTVKKGSNIKSVQRHYLKPPRDFSVSPGEKKDQKFGNMMISLNSEEGIIKSLKLSATHYNDHLFKKAYTFDSLINLLCQ